MHDHLDIREGALDTQGGYRHWPLQDVDPGLQQALDACIVSQRTAAARGGPSFVPDPEAQRHCSDQALEKALARRDETSDIRTDPSLTNCLAFHTSGLPGSVVAGDVTRFRERADRFVRELADRVLPSELAADLRVSGHFWYPPGSYMGWHTNRRVPGWRVYFTHVEEPGRSYFRYRDTRDGSVRTSWDTRWDLRIFSVDPDRPLWHSVYSGTHRYSFGYRVAAEANAPNE